MFETKDTKLCRGCLSSDRKLTSVSAGDLNLYYSLLAEDRKLDALRIPDLDLCWECMATLRRIQIFRARVRRAHTTLEDSLGLPWVIGAFGEIWSTRIGHDVTILSIEGTTDVSRDLLIQRTQMERNILFTPGIKVVLFCTDPVIQKKTGKATLSSLTIQQKLEYDVIFEETKPNDQPLFFKTKVSDITVEKIVIPTKYKALVPENPKNFKNESNDDLINIDSDNDETGIMSDDSDDHENLDACDSRPSPPEISIKKKTSRKKLQDVKIVKHSNLNAEKRKGRAQLQAQRIIINRPVKYSKYAPAILKTPVIAKLELELQKLMQNAKNSAKHVTPHQNTSKQKKTKKESSNENSGSSKDISENNDVDREDDSESSAEDDASNDDCKEPKNKRVKPDPDPDFSLEAYSDSDKSKSEEDGSRENLCDSEKEKMTKQKRFKKTIITRYKHIDEVLSCFTEIEMSVDDLKSYLEKQDAIVDEKKPHGCSICGQRFQRYRFLTSHGLRCHKATHPAQMRKGCFYNPPPTIPEKPILWRCSVCTTMVRREHVLAHMNAHHRTQYYCNGEGCEWSLKGFWIREDFVEHWAAIHKQFTCNICGKRKTKKAEMELHIMEAHIRLPKQQCPHCTRMYVHRKALLRHVAKRHSDPEPAERRYCVECDVTFNTVAALQKHFYNIHNEAREKFPCPDCGRVLATRSSYQNHYNLIHTGKTKHRCHVCGKYFSKLQALEGHQKTHLNIKLPKTKPCTICGRKFQTNRILRQHIYTHTGERPYACPHCDAAYTQPYCLRVHLARRHDVRARVPVVPVKGIAATPAITQDDQ